MSEHGVYRYPINQFVLLGKWKTNHWFYTPFSGNLSWTCYFIVMRKRSHFLWFFWVRSLAIVSTIIEFFFRWQVLGHVPRKMLEPRIPIDSCRKGLLEGKQLELHLIFGHTQSTRPAAGLLKRGSSTCSAVWRSEGDPWRNSRGSCGVLLVFLTCVRMPRIFFWNIAASESTRFWPLADKKSSRGKANFHLTKDPKAETCRFWKMADSSKMAWPDHRGYSNEMAAILRQCLREPYRWDFPQTNRLIF